MAQPALQVFGDWFEEIQKVFFNFDEYLIFFGFVSDTICQTKKNINK